VPYFSWQRSHAVHHSRTNHLTEGETHVPYVKGDAKGTLNLNLHNTIGEGPFAALQLVAHLAFGWPAYLLTGATGGSARGVTNHFVPNVNTGPVELFPGSWKRKVWISDIGVVGVVAGLTFWACNAGLPTVAALYFGIHLSQVTRSLNDETLYLPMKLPFDPALWPLYVRKRLACSLHMASAHRHRCTPPCII
jgi:omega-6 fatty acid desaturase (delta-12 desaturase)